MSKMTDFVAIRCVYSSSKYTKTRFRPGCGLRPGPRWGSLRHSPRPSSRLGRGTSPPHSLPPRRLRRLDLSAPLSSRSLSAFGASGVRPPTQIPGFGFGPTKKFGVAPQLCSSREPSTLAMSLPVSVIFRLHRRKIRRKLRDIFRPCR